MASNPLVIATRDEAARFGAPIVPPETCPVADSLGTLVGAIGADLRRFREYVDGSIRKTVPRHEVVELLADQEANLASASLRVEELRAANAQLRAAGRYWRNQARDYAAELDRKDAE